MCPSAIGKDQRRIAIDLGEQSYLIFLRKDSMALVRLSAVLAPREGE